MYILGVGDVGIYGNCLVTSVILVTLSGVRDYHEERMCH